MATRAVLLVALVALLCREDIGADEFPRLAGSSKTNKEADRESTDIVIAKFTKLGFPGPESSGESGYDRAEVEIAQTLRGGLSDKVEVFYLVFDMPGKDQEHPPQSGIEYVLFVRKLGPNELEVEKILPATDDNLASIKKLISN